jgi:hypothetical protein
MLKSGDVAVAVSIGVAGALPGTGVENILGKLSSMLRKSARVFAEGGAI